MEPLIRRIDVKSVKADNLEDLDERIVNAARTMNEWSFNVVDVKRTDTFDRNGMVVWYIATLFGVEAPEHEPDTVPDSPAVSP